ncbi:MAG: hypothetical protein ACRC33_23070 [Gemmataceae bacterium]
MTRVGLGAAAGLTMTVLILVAARWALRALEPDKALAVEHHVVYTTLVLGAGFGAVCGAILDRKPPS